MSRRFLVTGGAGFIGSHLCDALLAAGHEVLSLDDLSTGSLDNLAHLGDTPSFRAVTGSILDNDVLSELTENVDGVFHLAAAVGNDLILEQRVRSIETNVIGTANVLARCSERRLPVLVTSSSEVYGKSAALPFHEDDDLVLGSTRVPRWSYGCGKALDEFIALAAAAETGIPVFLTRLFNTTGPRQSGDYGMVLPRFVRQALRGETLTVYGDGSQSRCFCDVEDIADALTKLMDCDEARGTVVNLGGDEEVGILDLARRVLELTESISSIEHVAPGPGTGDSYEDIQRRVPHLGRARSLIGFQPRKRLDDIIRRVIEFEQMREGEREIRAAAP